MKILAEVVEYHPWRHFSYLLLDSGRVAKGAVRGVTGLGGRQAGFLALFGFEVQVGTQFPFQVSLGLFLAPPPHLSSL
jgi:hypothetical protein